MNLRIKGSSKRYDYSECNQMCFWGHSWIHGFINSPWSKSLVSQINITVWIRFTKRITSDQTICTMKCHWNISNYKWIPPVRVFIPSEHGYHESVQLWKPAWSSKIYLWEYQHREYHHHQMSANNHMSWCHGLQCILLLWRQNCPHRILSGQVWPIKVIYELSQITFILDGR